MSAPDLLDQLRKLAALKDEGVIDAGEFSRLKAELLARAVGVIGSLSSSADNQAQRPSDTCLPMADSLTAQLDAIRVTEPEVLEWKDRVSALEQKLEQLTKAHQDRLARRSATQRRVRHFTFLQSARGIFRGFAWGRIAPIMVATALGLLFGIVIVGIFPLSTGLVFAAGMLMAGVALLASLHVFVVPRDELVAERLAVNQRELIQLEQTIPQGELELAAAKNSLDEANRQYLEIAQRFESRRNQMLLFDWRTLRGIPFEKFLRAIFEELGYQVRLTKMSGDQGVDLIIEKDNVCIAVQAKGYAENVGNAAVQQAHAGMTYHKCNRCAVVTNSCFTSSAIELAARLGCVLVDASQIPALILGEVRL